jgi:sugar phosphate permease
MLADAVPKATLGRAIGFHRMMDTVGAILGPLLAALLLSRVPLRSVFWIAMIPGVLAAVAFVVLIPAQDTTSREPPPSLLAGIRALPSPFRRFLVAVASFGIGDFARTLLVLRASELLANPAAKGSGAATAMLLFSLHHAVAAACAFPVGYLADRMSPRKLLAAGYVLGVVTALLAAFAQPALWFHVLLFTVAGMVIGIEETLEGVLCAKLVPSKLRGSAYGLLAATNGIGDMVASAVVGVVWSLYGAALAFCLAAGACAIGTLLLLFVVPDEETSHVE